MKKKHYRDYAVASYRFWASSGGFDAFQKRIADMFTRSPTFSLQKAQFTGAIEDLLAVERSLEILSHMKNGADIVRAIRIVYCADAQRRPGRSDIQARIHYAELTIPASEAAIYRWLRLARDTFAEQRGLRLMDAGQL